MLDNVEEMAADFRDTEIGRILLEHGLERGERTGIELAVTDLLAARFPAADPARIQPTAARLVEGQHRHAARAAMTLGDLDA